MRTDYIVGIDEVGRGPLAGPVSIGIVVAPSASDFLHTFPGLKDSKLMTEKARECLYDIATAEQKAGAISWGVFSVSSEVIDDRGIEFALRTAISDGLQALMPDPDSGKVFLDGRLKAPQGYEQESLIRGDQLVPAISLASVVAKVSRDRFMASDIAAKYPAYGFEKHKGYGTASHIQAIREHGPSAVHRLSFLSRILDFDRSALAH